MEQARTERVTMPGYIWPPSRYSLSPQIDVVASVKGCGGELAMDQN